MNLQELIQLSPSIQAQGVEERVAKFQSRSVKGTMKASGLRKVLSMIDLTTLEGKDSVGKVQQLCSKAKQPDSNRPDLPTVAAICVFPSMVGIAKKELLDTSIKIASVASGFPSGQTTLAIKKADTLFALDEGADEIDMVISRGKFLAGEYNYVFEEIAALKELCGEKTLKVILETGELGDLDNVRKASDLAIAAGADFIKTSTGKIQPAATMPVTYVMLQAIRDHYMRTGQKVGMKPAGGISNSKLALHYLIMVKETLGDEWLQKDLFRFGASSLANDVLMQIYKTENGRYASPNYFSID